MEEIADARIVAVAIDSFVFEMVFVVPQLVFDVRKLGVELIVFGFVCRVKGFVACHIKPPPKKYKKGLILY